MSNFNTPSASTGGAPLLRLRAVCARVGLSEPSIYRLMALGVFPRPLKVGLRAVAWRETDISAWIESRAEA